MPPGFVKEGESRHKNNTAYFSKTRIASKRNGRNAERQDSLDFQRFHQQLLVSIYVYGLTNLQNGLKGRKDIHVFERALQKMGYQRIAGVDEAGRGPLAGPVVASAVILPIDCVIVGVADSKQLTSKQRDLLFDEIQHTAASVGISYIDSEAIDRVNILQATMRAMRESIEQIAPPPDYVLVDGTQLPTISVPAKAIPKGDSLSQSVAAASIVAKVTRDRLMIELDKIYPQYGFRRHKGYGTDQHRQALLEFGPCPIHRQTFKPLSER